MILVLSTEYGVFRGSIESATSKDSQSDPKGPAGESRREEPGPCLGVWGPGRVGHMLDEVVADLDGFSSRKASLELASNGTNLGRRGSRAVNSGTSSANVRLR